MQLFRFSDGTGVQGVIAPPGAGSLSPSSQPRWLTRLTRCPLSAEHTGHRHAQSEEADAPLQQRQRGRDAGVLGAGERRRRAQQTRLQAPKAPGQGPGLPPLRVLQGGEEPPGLRVSLHLPPASGRLLANTTVVWDEERSHQEEGLLMVTWAKVEHPHDNREERPPGSGSVLRLVQKRLHVEESAGLL